MSELDDFEFGGSKTSPEDGRGPRRGLPLGAMATLAVVALGLIGGTVYLLLRKPSAPRPAPIASPAAALGTPSPSPTPTAMDLPPLDHSDTLFRDLAKGLSAHPQIVVWLAAHDFVRTLTAVVENVAEGDSPRPHLGFLAPKGSFGVTRRKGRLAIDPRSYGRYDDFADAVASLDAAGCARVYSVLAPLFEAAYRDLGHPESGFAKAAGRAIASLIEVPVLEGDVAVRPVPRAVIVYELVDPRLEHLSPAQKHLLRMGPRNVGRIQAKLSELAGALGLQKG